MESYEETLAVSSLPPFELRAYPKKMLALYYFPHLQPGAALHKLGKWIRRCPDLSDRLYGSHESKNDRWFSRRQVELIVRYLDEP